jgi:LysR family transcriptional regulator, nod-box dependent transcriptional activator
MHFKGLDLNLIVALDALLTHRSVTRAAQALHLSQPAMSGSLARLRAHYDDQLLVRYGQEFHLTCVAEGLAEPIRSVLLQMEAALDMKLSFDPLASERNFVLMASDYISIVLISPTLQRVGRAAPGVTFNIVPFTPSPWQALERGDVDLLIIADNLVSADQPFETLFDDEFVCLCWSKNDLVDESLSAEQFLSLGHVVCRYGNGEVSYIEEKFFRNAGYDRRIEVVASTFSEVPHFLVGTQRIAITHRKLAEAFSRNMPLRYFEPPVAMPTVRQAMQWHSYRHKDPAIEWLREQLRIESAR